MKFRYRLIATNAPAAVVNVAHTITAHDLTNAAVYAIDKALSDGSPDGPAFDYPSESDVSIAAAPLTRGSVEATLREELTSGGQDRLDWAEERIIYNRQSDLIRGYADRAIRTLYPEAYQ